MPRKNFREKFGTRENAQSRSLGRTFMLKLICEHIPVHIRFASLFEFWSAINFVTFKFTPRQVVLHFLNGTLKSKYLRKSELQIYQNLLFFCFYYSTPTAVKSRGKSHKKTIRGKGTERSGMRGLEASTFFEHFLHRKLSGYTTFCSSFKRKGILLRFDGQYRQKTDAIAEKCNCHVLYNQRNSIFRWMTL